MYGLVQELRVRPDGTEERKQFPVENVKAAIELNRMRSEKLASKGFTVKPLENLAFVACSPIGYKVEFSVKTDGLPLHRIAEGLYTVTLGDGTRRTFRVRTRQAGPLIGKRIISYLGGPDNEQDYVGFAFLSDGDTRISIWKKFQNSDLEKYAVVLLADPKAAGEAYAMESGRCYRCNRVLTVPASIHRGMGPECAQKEGI